MDFTEQEMQLIKQQIFSQEDKEVIQSNFKLKLIFKIADLYKRTPWFLFTKFLDFDAAFMEMQAGALV